MEQTGIGAVVGRRVARIRKNAKISAGELAERAGSGLTRSVIANLENGRKDDLAVSQLVGLARALEVTVDELLVGDAHLETTFEHARARSRSAAAELARYTRALVELADLLDESSSTSTLDPDELSRILSYTPLAMVVGTTFDFDRHLSRVNRAPGDFVKALQARFTEQENVVREYLGRTPIVRDEDGEVEGWARTFADIDRMQRDLLRDDD